MKRIILTLLFLTLYLSGIASNIQLTEPNLTDSLSNEVSIGLRFTWEKSWYCQKNHPPHNWDAAWIFVKYKRTDSEDWFHATIKKTKNGSLSQDTIPLDNMGAMVFRKAPGYGEFSDTLTIIWDRKKDFQNIQKDLDEVLSEICVFAIEMVYVPQGVYFLGDGTGGANYGVYCDKLTGAPYSVQSEAAVTVGPAATDILYKSPSNWVAESAPLDVNYPKGFNDFYCMKTEISQKQYCDFLNKLNPLQIKEDPSNSIYSSIILDFADSPELIKYGNTILKNEYGEYYTTTPYRACNFLTSLKVLAYLSWSGLRPMSAFEYEKACRGPVLPSAGEYAWGKSTCIPATGFEKIDTSEEYYKSPSGSKSNIHITSILRDGTKESGQDIGPGRVGAFANDTTNRVLSGASYYGILDLSGGVAELVVHHWFGSPLSYNFSRNVHGNGLPLRKYDGVALYPSSWPQIPLDPICNTGYGHRGGHFMCKPNKTDNAYHYDPSTGQVSAQGRAGGTQIYYGHIVDYSYAQHPNKAEALKGYYIHGYGGRGVRSF